MKALGAARGAGAALGRRCESRPRAGGLPRLGEQQRRSAVAPPGAAQRRALPRPPRRPRTHTCGAGSFLVPDITQNPGDSMAVVEAARAAADAMSLPEVVLRVAVEMTLAIVVSRVIVTLVAKLGRRAEKVIAAEHSKPRSNVPRMVLDAGIQAAQRPARLLVPAVAAIFSLRTLALGLQILVEDELFRSQRAMRRGLTLLLGALAGVDRYTNEVWQLGVIALTLWVLLDWKERLVRLVIDLEKKHKESGEGTMGLSRIVLPLSSLGGWALIAVGALSAMQILGINIQPLLAVGGVTSFALALGSQTVTANAIAGINLFLTRPFVVGDRIELKTGGGGTVLVGVVESIDPMRTRLRTDAGIPVSVPNKAITDFIVANESRLGRSCVIADFKDPRQWQTSFKVKNADFDKLRSILEDVEAYLRQSAGVDQSLPLSAKVQALGDTAVTVNVMAHTTATQSRNYQQFNHEVLLAVADILQQRGVKFA